MLLACQIYLIFSRCFFADSVEKRWHLEECWLHVAQIMHKYCSHGKHGRLNFPKMRQFQWWIFSGLSLFGTDGLMNALQIERGHNNPKTAIRHHSNWAGSCDFPQVYEADRYIQQWEYMVNGGRWGRRYEYAMGEGAIDILKDALPRRIIPDITPIPRVHSATLYQLRDQDALKVEAIIVCLRQCGWWQSHNPEDSWSVSELLLDRDSVYQIKRCVRLEFRDRYRSGCRKISADSITYWKLQDANGSYYVMGIEHCLRIQRREAASDDYSAGITLVYGPVYSLLIGDERKLMEANFEANYLACYHKRDNYINTIYTPVDNIVGQFFQRHCCQIPRARRFQNLKRLMKVNYDEPASDQNYCGMQRVREGERTVLRWVCNETDFLWYRLFEACDGYLQFMWPNHKVSAHPIARVSNYVLDNFV